MVLRELATKWRLQAIKAMRFYVNLRRNHDFTAIPSHQSYTVLCKFKTQSRFLATKAIRFYVNLRLDRESNPAEAQKTHNLRQNGDSELPNPQNPM
jgi:hypothetical protein